MYFVIAICLVYMLALFIGIMIRLITLSNKERLSYIKNFKRGKFALIYIAMMPLYFLAYRYNGVSIEGAVLQSIASGIETVGLKYPFNTTSPLMGDNLFYHITVGTGFVLVTLNAIMFTFSLIGQLLYNTVSLWITRFFRKKIVVVVGYNPNSLDIVKSTKKVKGKAVIIDKLTQEIKDNAFLYKANYAQLNEEDLGTQILKLFRKFQKKKVYVILNCEDDSKSLLYIKQLDQIIESENLTSLPLTEDYGLQVYVFGEKTNESVFTRYTEQSKGLIKFINRHEQIALDFISRYPMTQFMTDRQIDYSTATIKKEVELNVFMIGFGNLNETLFLTSVSNNQFLTLINQKLQPKTVNYHIYDRNYPEGKITQENQSVYSRSLNHGYRRYKEFLKLNENRKNEYLEFVVNPANVKFHPYDFAHPDFYNSVKVLLCNKNAYSYFIVSFGSDIENIDLAEKMQQKFREWNVPSTVKIFVKVRDDKMVKEIKKDFEGDTIILFGTNRSCAYDASAIINEKTEHMAKLRHLIYIAETEQRKHTDRIVSITEEELKNRAREKWYSYKQFQRESNIFACLSIRMKLQMLGYDYSTEGNDCANEFRLLYEKNDTPEISKLKIDGKPILNYSNAEQNRNSIRRTYAVQEHQRWCANMICNGIIPCDKEEIKKSGGRVMEKRMHANVTTMDGLIEFREIVANSTGKSVEETDVIRYDYQLMDDIVWLLHKCDYKLIKKN